VTSPAQIAANRRNAARSTGPRTEAGKAQSRRNALKHGLRVPLEADPSLNEQLDTLTNDLARLLSKPREAVRCVAQQQIEIMRIQQTRAAIINRYLQQRLDQDVHISADTVAMATAEALPEIVRLDRYEQRALSKLVKQLKILDARDD